MHSFCCVEAIEVLKKNPDISFIVSDVKMPNGDGIMLLNYVKINYPNIKIIILSGFSETTEEVILEMGAFAYLGKPTNIDELILFVQSNS